MRRVIRIEYEPEKHIRIMSKYIIALSAGVLAGILGGMGLGGGTVLIPLLTLWAGIEQQDAQGANLIAYVPTAIIALILSSRSRLLRTKGTGHLILPAIIAALIASATIARIDGEYLRLAFALFLTSIGIYSLFDTLRQERKKHMWEN